MQGGVSYAYFVHAQAVIVRPMSEAATVPTCPACGSTRVDRTYSYVYAETSKKS
jgi:hypothetical protein